MSSSHLQPVFTLFLIFTVISSLLFFAPTRCQDRPDPNPTPTPTPTPWPHQFHATLFMNNSGSLQLVDLWYDWPNGRNLNLIRDQLSPSLLYDLEWDNGTSYYYTLPGGGSGGGSCRTIHFEVGILRPDWLDGANYLGRRHVDGFLCDGWEKVDFIWYYEDVATRRPVFWAFFNGMTANVMTYEVGAMLEDAKWQAPAYCFVEEGGEDAAELAAASGVPGGWTQSPAAFNEPMNVSERGLGRVTKVASCHAERERERESGCVSIDVSPSRCRRHRTLPQGARWTMLRALILKDCCYGRR